MTERPRVTVVGSLHYDIMVRAPYLPRIGETLIGEAWGWKPGGKGGNQAMAAARYGAEVEMMGCLGSDEFGARLRERLAVARVGLEHVRTVVQGSGMSVAIEQDDGDYAAVVVSGANRDIDETQVARSAEAIRGSRVLLLQNEISEMANTAAARLAHDAGAAVILNAAPARPLGSIAGRVDVLVVNGVEAEMLGSDRVDSLEGAAVAAHGLRTLAATIIVTAGVAGVAAVSDAGTATVPAHPVSGTATHGAGDVFVGALAAQLADAAPLEQALRYANAAAALHVGTPEADREALGTADVRRLLQGTASDTAGA
ncbi:MAG: PfkB family carbohydrate kinase [Chloroflexota bacterium]